MEDWKQRTRLLIGDDGIDQLRRSHVLVVGLGGVVNATNRNRQLLALCSTEGRPKAEIMAERIRDINPDIELEVINQYMKDDAIIELVSKPYDGITAVFSPEPVDESAIVNVNEQNKVSNVGTISYMPAAFGIFCASAVINGLLRKD